MVSRHWLCDDSDHCSEPAGGQILRASSSLHGVLRGREQRLEGAAACASGGVLRGHVDLPLLQPRFVPNMGRNFLATTTLLRQSLRQTMELSS